MSFTLNLGYDLQPNSNDRIILTTNTSLYPFNYVAGSPISVTCNGVSSTNTLFNQTRWIEVQLLIFYNVLNSNL